MDEKEIKVACDEFWITRNESWGQYSYKIICYIGTDRVFIGHSRKSIYAYFLEE